MYLWKFKQESNWKVADKGFLKSMTAGQGGLYEQVLDLINDGTTFNFGHLQFRKEFNQIPKPEPIFSSQLSRHFS